jgi:hypothetical protein
MLRFLSRTIGLLFMAAAFVFLVYDGTKSIAANALVYTRLSEFWTIVSATSLQQFERSIEQHAASWLWDPVTVTVLDGPTFVVLGILGAFLVLLGRRPKPRIGFAR